MVPEPKGEYSEELAALTKRAERAIEEARHLIRENDRWRENVQQQLDYMFELGAEFRRSQRSSRP